MSFLARRLAGATPSLSRSFSASARREVARITLVGNLGHAPTLKTTASGKEIVEYALATQDGSNVPSWFHVAAFLEEGPRRQFMMNLPKGSVIYVEGNVSNKGYTDSEGNKKYRLSITQKAFEVLRRGTAKTEGQEGQE